MSLSCDFDFVPVPGMICWYLPQALAPLPTKRRRKCCSCAAPIAPGADSAEFGRFKIAERDIYGEDGDDMRQLAKDHAKLAKAGQVGCT
jgi:hypothetical protein